MARLSTEHIGEHLGGKRCLVLGHVLGHEHAAPLVAAYLAGLDVAGALDLGGTHDLVLLCLVDIHTAYTGQINTIRDIVEDVEAQFRVRLHNLIVFQTEFHAEPVAFLLMPLTNCREEAVGILLLRIYAE